MTLSKAMAEIVPHLISSPLLPLAALALSVLVLSTRAAADTTVQERAMQRERESSGESVSLTKRHAIGFGVMASLGLLAMWMWSNVLIYASLLTFGLGSFVSIQQCTPGIFRTLRLGRGQTWHHSTTAGLLVLAWFWYRNTSKGWIFQDILGGFTITLMLRVLKAPSMSSPTLLLLSAFFYDVFFVFVTPYLTKTGESIMEAAATGAALTVQENIPMLFRIPTNILDSILAAAVATTPGAQSGGEAMLGFGDVVLPGILITFLKECDARLEEDSCLSPATSIGLMGAQSSSKARRWSYHLTAVLGYALGLEVTFVAMMWSQRGQPALLYLVPFTVLPVVLLASKRHELGLLWHGWGELDEKELSRSESTEWEKENEDVVVMEESKEGRETKQQRRVSLVRSSKISL